MPLQIFLNELSLAADECDQPVAVQRLKTFAATMRSLEAVTRQIVLNADQPIAELSFGAGWPLAMLRNAPDCAEERTLLKTITDRAPFGLAIAERGGPGEDAFEYRIPQAAPRFASRAVRGLGFAHHCEGLAVSLATDPLWAEATFDLDRLFLSDDGEIRIDPASARNASTAEGVALHREALEEIVRPRIADGRTLWAHRAELFPHLVFISRTRSQIEALPAGDVTLQPLMEKLTALEGAIAQWAKTDAAHPAYAFFVRPESVKRLQRGLADFNDDAGRQHRFSDHADFGPNEGRLHFLLQTQPRRQALIGHADRKLGIG